MQTETGLDDLLDDIVGHQLAAGNQPANPGGQFRVTLNVPAKNIADADVHQLEILRQQLGLSPLAAALNAHDDEFSHGNVFR